MAVTFADYLSSAEFTLSTSQSEIDFRNAASRAHYAAYHACQCVSNYCNKPPDYSDHHEGLVLRFRHYPKDKPGYAAASKIGLLLNQTRARRAKADYHLTTTFTKDEATLSVKDAREIVKVIKNFSEAQAKG